MIIQLLIRIILSALDLVFGWFPDFSFLPTLGTINIDSYFATGMGYLHFLAQIFPPLTTLQIAVSIYLGFRAVLLIVKLVLGSRAPIHQ